MPRVHKQTARNDIYRYGSKVPSEHTKSGFRNVSSKPRDEEDEVIIKKGQTYYTWSFPFGGTYKQLTKPRRSQLTQSDFLGQWYDMQDRVSDFSCDNLEELNEEIQDVLSEVETLRDEQEEKKDNMPESLQESPTGELLQERYDALEELYGELESIDCDSEVESPDLDSVSEEDKEELMEEHENDMQTEIDDKLQEYRDAVENCSI